MMTPTEIQLGLDMVRGKTATGVVLRRLYVQGLIRWDPFRGHYTDVSSTRKDS